MGSSVWHQECGRFLVRQARHLAPLVWGQKRGTCEWQLASRPCPSILCDNLPSPMARGLRTLTGGSGNGPPFQTCVLLIMPHTGKPN